MDQELIAYLDERFRETSQQIDDGLERLESSLCYTQAAVEDLRDDLRLMAKALIDANRQLDSFRADVAWQFYDARIVIRRFQAELNRRVRPLESWKEREGRDPLDALRELYGKTPG
jgi:hypothetical protein